MKTAAIGFNECIAKRFSQRKDWPELKSKVEKFVGQWIVLHSLFLKQYFREYKIEDHDLFTVLPDLFKIPYIRRFRRYYYFGSIFMRLQRFQSDLRNSVLRRMRRGG